MQPSAAVGCYQSSHRLSAKPIFNSGDDLPGALRRTWRYQPSHRLSAKPIFNSGDDLPGALRRTWRYQLSHRLSAKPIFNSGDDLPGALRRTWRYQSSHRLSVKSFGRSSILTRSSNEMLTSSIRRVCAAESMAETVPCIFLQTPCAAFG